MSQLDCVRLLQPKDPLVVAAPAVVVVAGSVIGSLVFTLIVEMPLVVTAADVSLIGVIPSVVTPLVVVFPPVETLPAVETLPVVGGSAVVVDILESPGKVAFTASVVVLSCAVEMLSAAVDAATLEDVVVSGEPAMPVVVAGAAGLVLLVVPRALEDPALLAATEVVIGAAAVVLLFASAAEHIASSNLQSATPLQSVSSNSRSQGMPSASTKQRTTSKASVFTAHPGRAVHCSTDKMSKQPRSRQRPLPKSKMHAGVTLQSSCVRSPQLTGVLLLVSPAVAAAAAVVAFWPAFPPFVGAPSVEFIGVSAVVTTGPGVVLAAPAVALLVPSLCAPVDSLILRVEGPSVALTVVGRAVAVVKEPFFALVSGWDALFVAAPGTAVVEPPCSSLIEDVDSEAVVEGNS
jgi:hypothetical protein